MSPVVTVRPLSPMAVSARAVGLRGPTELAELPTPEFEPCDTTRLDAQDEAERLALDEKRRELGLESGWYYEDDEPTLGASLPSSPDGRTYVP